MPLRPIVLKGEQKRVLFLQVTDPIQIKGVAGSGKTTVALYRAKHLLDTQSNLFQEAKVAIFTYNKTLVKYINAIKPHISGGYRENSDEIIPTRPAGINGVNVINFDKWAYRFIETYLPNSTPLFQRTVTGANQKNVLNLAKSKYSAEKIVQNKSNEFFAEEIAWMKGKAFQSKEEYFEAKRTGRGTSDRVTKADKEIIWNIYTEYNNRLSSNNQVDFEDYALLCLKILQTNPNIPRPFTHIIVDEAQDLSKAQILVLSQIVSDKTKSISIIADAAQRIYKSGFTWGEVGLNVRGGRTIAFKKNYRNTKQIAFAAKSLLDKETDNEDFTEIEPVREGTQKPIVGYFANWNEQCTFLLKQLNKLKADGNINSTVILHRSHSGIRSVKDFLESNNFEVQELLKTDDIDFESDSIKVCTLSSVKGLEFENVFIIDLNDNVIPYPPGFNDAEDEFHISTERRLLYTSMTRARERLFLFSSNKNIPSRYLKEIDSELLDDISSNVNAPTQDFKYWKESLSYAWLNIFQAHIELSYNDDFFNSYFSDEWSWWGDMKEGDEDIFSQYMMEFGKRIYPNYDVITQENILKIKSLNLIRLNLTDLKPLSYLINVSQIQAYSNQISNIKGLESLKKLKYLSLDDNKIETDNQLLELSSIEGLEINKNPIKSIDNILTHKSINELVAIECDISSIEPKKNCNLKYLDVAYNNISKVELENLKELERLRIESNPIRSIINELKHTTKISSVFLDNTEVTKEEKEKIRSNNIEVYEWNKG